jgi:hypothetical protein
VKKRKGFLFAVILTVVLVADISLFGPQILAVVMEASNGYHLDLHGIRFHTPAFYTSSKSVSYDEYLFDTTPSPTRRKNAVITVDFKKQAPTGAHQPFSTEMQKKIGWSLTKNRRVVLAGRTGDCFEYTNRFGMAEIQCSFGTDLRTSFMGSRNSIDDFYILMSKAEELPRKN